MARKLLEEYNSGAPSKITDLAANGGHWHSDGFIGVATVALEAFNYRNEQNGTP
jgi:hypothetical protein